MSNQSNNTSGGIGFAGLLTICFVVLKLTDFIDWSWWYVTMPLWLVPVTVIGGFLVYGLIRFGLYCFNSFHGYK